MSDPPHVRDALGAASSRQMVFGVCQSCGAGSALSSGPGSDQGGMREQLLFIKGLLFFKSVRTTAELSAIDRYLYLHCKNCSFKNLCLSLLSHPLFLMCQVSVACEPQVINHLNAACCSESPFC